MTRKIPKWLYIAEYKCGCSEDSARRRDLLNYCGTHGEDRRRIHKLPNMENPQVAKAVREAEDYEKRRSGSVDNA